MATLESFCMHIYFDIYVHARVTYWNCAQFFSMWGLKIVYWRSCTPFLIHTHTRTRIRKILRISNRYTMICTQTHTHTPMYTISTHCKLHLYYFLFLRMNAKLLDFYCLIIIIKYNLIFVELFWIFLCNRQ